jgi:hypothetical protein
MPRPSLAFGQFAQFDLLPPGQAMSTNPITACGVVAAPSGAVYAAIADYRDSHPQIVPPGFFRNFVVEQGGVGAGTIVRFEAVVFGRGFPMRSEITEPIPGRVLAERDMDRGTYTTFTVEPRDDGRSSFVTISTTFPARGGTLGGLLGGVERALMQRLLVPMYHQELRRLEHFAQKASDPARPAPRSVPSA